MNETINSNPKALNLGAIMLSQTKVTLGFKCHPNVKLDLAEKAHKLGLTLSEYVENLIMNSEKLFENFQLQEKEEKERLTFVNNQQKEKIDFYENDFLKNLYRKYENQMAEYKNENNEVVKLKIADIKNIYSVIINSFKIENNEPDTNTISIGQINT